MKFNKSIAGIVSIYGLYVLFIEVSVKFANFFYQTLKVGGFLLLYVQFVQSCTYLNW